MPSVTEILAWNQCHYLHHLAYVRNLARLERPANLAIGAATHAAIGELLTNGGERAAVAEAKYRAELTAHEDLEGLVARNLGRITRTIGKFPFDDFRGGDWRLEERLEVVLDGQTIIAKPDLYRKRDGIIDIVEIKGSENEPLSYLLFNPQHRYYGVVLDALNPGNLIQFTYVCLTERGCKTHEPFVFTRAALDKSRALLIQYCREMAIESSVPNEGWWCRYCDFKDVCEERIAHGSGEEIIARDFAPRVR